MKNAGIEQVHIIPFDLGCVFYDCLSLNNSKNLAFAKLFNNKLVEICKAQGIIIEDNIELKYLGKTITGIKYKNNTLAESAICIAHIMPHLKCYVLANGIGVFVFTRLNDILRGAIQHIDSIIIGNIDNRNHLQNLPDLGLRNLIGIPNRLILCHDTVREIISDCDIATLGTLLQIDGC